jgi:hypothetical protein
MRDQEATRIPCSKETRSLIVAEKRGGETYDSVLRKMVAQYDAERAAQARKHEEYP